jgi:hypothetical protein
VCVSKRKRGLEGDRETEGEKEETQRNEMFGTKCEKAEERRGMIRACIFCDAI